MTPKQQRNNWGQARDQQNVGEGERGLWVGKKEQSKWHMYENVTQ